MTLVELSRVEVVIDGQLILGPIDLSVGEGEHWVMLGPNGSGKTTLLGLAGARRQPSAGTVRVLGLTLGHGDVRTLHPRIGHCSGALAEMLPSNMTAEEVVLTGRRSTFATWFQTYDDEDRRRVREMLEDVGCSHLANRPLATGSQGERQRVLLGRALVADPALLILDEPAAGLDFPAREGLIAAFEAAAARSEALTTLHATHHLEEVPPSTTHAALLRSGRLVAAGPVGEVFTPAALRASFDVDVEVGRRHGRWWATAVPAAGLTPVIRFSPARDPVG